MNNESTPYLSKFTLTFLLALLVTVCSAQNNVRLLNGATFIGESTASAADNRLATELPNHDVRISYVASFVEIQDRFKDYEENDLLPFSQIPYLGGFTPATQAEKDAAVNAGIHHAITTLPSPSESTIHIIYAVSVSLNAQGEEEFSSRKFFKFGNEVDRRSEKIVEQIKPDPELAAAGVVSGNDSYLTDYVDELILALNDPNYVINGSIEYNGAPYFDGDTIFYFHPTDEIVETEVAGLQELKLLINQDYPVTPVNWVETEQVSGAGTLFASNSGGTANIKIKADHFTGIAKFTGTYGVNTTTVWYYPINPVLDLGAYEDYVMESHEDISVQLYMYNNQEQFREHPGVVLKTDVFTAYGSVASEMFSINASDYNVMDWSRLSDQCDYVDLRYHITRKGTTVLTRTKRIGIKCPFDIDDLSITAVYDTTSSSTRTAFSGDTLFIVSKENGLTRDVNYNLQWDGQVPVNDAYWVKNPTTIGDEPVWYFASPTGFPSGEAPPLSSYFKKNDFDIQYKSHFFPGVGWINVDVGETNINYFKAGVRAFDQNREVTIGFLRENKHSLGITIPVIEDLIDIVVGALQGLNDATNAVSGQRADLDISMSVKLETKNAEDNDTRFYRVQKAKKLAGNIKLIGDDIPFAPPFAYTIPYVGTVGGYVSWNLYFEPSYKWTDHRLNYETSFYHKDELFQLRLGGKGEFGAKLELLPALEVIEFEFKGYAAANLFGAYSLITPTPPSGKRNRVELTFAPITLNVSGKVKINIGDGLGSITLVNISHAWAMTDAIGIDYKW